MSASRDERQSVREITDNYAARLTALGHDVTRRLAENATRKGHAYYMILTCANCHATMCVGSTWTSTQGRDLRQAGPCPIDPSSGRAPTMTPAGRGSNPPEGTAMLRRLGSTTPVAYEATDERPIPIPGTRGTLTPARVDVTVDWDGGDATVEIYGLDGPGGRSARFDLVHWNHAAHHEVRLVRDAVGQAAIDHDKRNI